MKRRQVLGFLGVAAAAPSVMAAEQAQHSHASSVPALVAAASNCVVRGEICLAHCHLLLATGDKSMGPCSKTASEMSALCGALRSVAAQDAPSLRKLAAVALDACSRCEAECRKHEAHTPCKDCAEACAACAAECRKLA